MDLGKARGECIFLYFWMGNVCYCAFCWQRKRSRKAEEGPAEAFRKGRDNPYLASPAGDRERHTQQLCIFAALCVCVHCQWAETADSGGSSFLGEFRDLGQGIFASIKTLHFRLTRSDYPIKPV